MKLVSKNPILRFKLGNQILYYEIGGTARKIIRGWKEALFPWTRKNPNFLDKQINNRAPIKNRLYFVDSSIRNNNNIIYLLRNRYRRINPNNLQPQNPSTTTQQSNPLLSGTSNVSSQLSFKDAFNRARNSRLKEFTWGGKRFNTMTAAEKKAGATLFLNGRWVNPAIKFAVPTPTDMTSEEIEELNRKAKPISNWEGASFAKQGIKLFKNRTNKN